MKQDFGLNIDPLGMINELKNNLVDRYPRDSILKELLQNADDAKATRLDFGWSAGFPNADHILLQGPGLFAVNNGPFKKEDEKAIRSFGLNYKAADRTTIGKFGLGLKSVFNLCEAFFFLAKTEAISERDHDTIGSIVNPWFGTGLHGDWNSFSPSDQSLLKQDLDRLLKDKAWFILWLPLRKKDHCHIQNSYEPDPEDLDEPPIQENALHSDYPGEATSCPSDLSSAQAKFFADQLPLLRSVRQVRLWTDWDGETTTTPQFDVEITDNSPRCRFPERFDRVLGGPGTVRVDFLNQSSCLTYALKQGWLTELDNFRKRPSWPKTMSFVGPKPDKALPHFAVSFSRCSQGKNLSIAQAVFLPLRSDNETRFGSDGWKYSLKLHGCYFIDAGRGQPVAVKTDSLGITPSSDENKLKSEWNSRLLREGSCRILLPALDDLVCAAKMDDTEIKSLTLELCKSDFGQEYMVDITITEQWLYCWHPADTGWRRLPRTAEVLEIPDFAQDGPTIVKESLPRLSQLASQYSLTPMGWPRLTSAPMGSWSDDLLANALVFGTNASAPVLNYCQRFLENAQPRGQGSYQAIADSIRTLFGSAEIGQLRSQRQTVTALIDFVPAAQRCGLPLTGNWPIAIRKDFCRRQFAVLIVPKEFEPTPEPPGSGTLTVEEASDLLTSIKDLVKYERADLPRALISVCNDRQSLLNTVSALRFWPSQYLDSDQTKEGLASFAELRESHNAGRLYLGPINDWLRDFRKATVGPSLVVISQDIASELFPENTLKLANETSLLRALGKYPTLAPAPAARLSLFRRLLASQSEWETAMWRIGLRYLLTGHADLPDTDTLFLPSASTGALARLTSAALDLPRQSARVLEAGELSKTLNPEQSLKLGVASLDREGVAELLREVGPESIQIVLSKDEADRILHEFSEETDILQSLPLHEGLDGRYHRISKNTFWVTDDFLPPKSLVPHIVGLRLNAKPNLSSIQKQLAPEFTPEKAIQLASDLSPSTHWRAILIALGGVPKPNPETLPNVRWLPTRAGGFVALSQILDDQNLQSEITIVLKKVQRQPTDPLLVEELHDDVRQHPDFKSLRCLLPERKAVVEKLAGLLRRNTWFSIGNLSGSMDLRKPEDVNHWIEAFRDATPEVMPIRSLVEKVFSADERWCIDILLPSLREAILQPRLERIFRHLRGQHTEKRHDFLIRLHNTYLMLMMTDSAMARELFPSLQLLNLAGEWSNPSTLCAGITGLDRTRTLDHEQKEILKGVIAETPAPSSHRPNDPRGSTRSNTTPINKSLEGTKVTLREYFDPWKKHSEEFAAWAGAFVALLGDDPLMKQLASDLLPVNHSSGSVRAHAGFKNTGYHVEGHFLNQTSTQRLASQWFEVAVTDPSKPVEVLNLFGHQMKVKFLQNCENLLIEDVKDLKISEAGPSRIHRLHLRWADLVNPDREKLRGQLAETGRLVLLQVYGLQDSDFGNILKEIGGENNLAVRVTQVKFLNGATYNLRLLGLTQTSHEELRQVLKDFDAAAQRKAEYEVHDKKKCRGVLDLLGDHPQKIELKSRNTLQRLIENDSQVQTEIGDAVRRKLAEYRYRPQSILFELFQNADDAYVELGTVQNVTVPVFAVEYDQTQLTVLHAGRRINQPGPGGPNSEGHPNDLQKMISVGHSDKGCQVGAPEVTGRFGLGFKSVFLVCDRPRVISGRIGFEVLAGVYPIEISKNTAETLRSHLEKGGFQADQATAFELPIRQGSNISEVVNTFWNLAYLMVIFSRRIRRIRWHPLESRSPHTTTWEENLLCHNAGVKVVTGVLEPAIKGPSRALVFRTKDGDVLFGLGQEGFVPLSDDVPTVWATAPTQELHRQGWLVNAAFKLDVGRSQVDWNGKEIVPLLQRIGNELGNGLSAFFDWFDTIDPAGLRSQLGFLGADKYSFWESFWQVVSKSPAGTGLLPKLMWEEGFGGIAELYQNRCALPTGISLPNYRILTRITDVRAVLADTLDNADSSELKHIAQWPSFQSFVAGTIVSAKVFDRLTTLSPFLLRSVERIDLEWVLRYELANDGLFSPERAVLFGRVVTRERAEYRPILKQEARFLSNANEWELACELLLSNDYVDHRDEAKIAAFAPPERVLSNRYIGDSLTFFLACREYAKHNLDEMARWAKSATTATAQKAVLVYLKEGEKHYLLKNELHRLGIQGSWLEKLDREQLAESGCDEREQTATLVTLGVFPARNSGTPLEKSLSPESLVPTGMNPSFGVHWPLEPAKLPTRPAKDSLQRIHSWWNQKSAIYINQYNKKYVPNGSMVQAIKESHDDNTYAARAAWLRLFVSGSLATLGRVTPDQNRAFLKLCDELNCFQTVLNPALGSTGWLRTVEAYFDDKVQEIPYFNWFRHSFLNVVCLARHLEVFAASFRAIDLTPGDFRMHHVLASKINTHLSGTGLEAPPLEPILGIGVCEVLRELARGGVVKSEKVKLYCYPPVDRIKKLLSDLGWDQKVDGDRPWDLSRSIFDFLAKHLDDPTFDGSFDLPLLALADDTNLQRQVLEG